MLRQIIFAGLVAFFAMTAQAAAAGDQSVAGQVNAAAPNLKDPMEADAAAIAGIEPAAGGGNIFTATLDAQKNTDKHSQDPDPHATAAEKTRRGHAGFGQ